MGSSVFFSENSFNPGKETFCSECVKRNKHKKCTAGVTSLIPINGRLICNRKEIAVHRILLPQEREKTFQQI